MSKKSAALSASLVAVKGAGTPSPDMQVRGSASTNSKPFDDVPPSNSTFEEAPGSGNASGAPLNFRVSESFRREFKIFAAQHGFEAKRASATELRSLPSHE